MRLMLQDLQKANLETQKIKNEQLGNKNWQEIDGLLYHQSLLFEPRAIWRKLISYYHNDFLVGYFDIKKAQELLDKN